MWREADVFYNLDRGSEARNAQLGSALELAQASRSAVITPEGLLHRLHTDQNESISPTMLLATLPPAVALMLFIGIACGQQAVGSPPETPISAPTVRPITPTVTPNATANAEAQKASAEATATAEAQEKIIPEVIALIGEPIGYRPATKEETVLFTPQRPGELPFIPRPGVKTDSQGNLLIPRYSPGTILGELETIRAENYYPEEVTTGRQQEIYRWMGQIEQVIQKVSSRDFKKAKELLNATTWDGIEKASRGDKYSFKIGRLPHDPDQNGNGISDLLESAYNLIKKALSRLA